MRFLHPNTAAQHGPEYCRVVPANFGPASRQQSTGCCPSPIPGGTSGSRLRRGFGLLSFGVLFGAIIVPLGVLLSAPTAHFATGTGVLWRSHGRSLAHKIDLSRYFAKYQLCAAIESVYAVGTCQTCPLFKRADRPPRAFSLACESRSCS